MCDPVVNTHGPVWIMPREYNTIKQTMMCEYELSHSSHYFNMPICL